MPVNDKRRKTKPHEPPRPYEVHRPAAFTDGNGPAPAVVAVDAQPRAGEYPVPMTLSVGGKVLARGTLMMPQTVTVLGPGEYEYEPGYPVRRGPDVHPGHVAGITADGTRVVTLHAKRTPIR